MRGDIATGRHVEAVPFIVPWDLEGSFMAAQEHVLGRRRDTNE
jgi:hypothetical protein